MEKIDETHLVNSLLPKTWTCPHCGKRFRMDPQAEEIFLEFFKVIRQCSNCGQLHIWTLELTEEFKQKTIDFILKM